MDARIDVFFYGLFMDADLLRAKGLHPEGAATGWVEGACIFIGARAGLVRKAGSRAYGVVMSLPDDEVDVLYADESLRSYRPERVQVRLSDGGTRGAACYNVAPELAGVADPTYVANLRLVARRAGLPEDYVSSL